MDERTMSALAERVEADALAALFDLATPEVRRSLGLEYVRRGGGVATVATPGCRQPLWTRAVGFGWLEPITNESVEAVCDLHRRHQSHEVRFQVSPWVRGDWETTLELNGFTPDITWMKFVRDTSPPPDAFTLLRVRELAAADAHRYASVFTEGFGLTANGSAYTSSVSEWMRRQMGSADWRLFGAFDGDHMVGCASMYLAGEGAELLGATTVPAARNRGAQSALLVEQLRCAARLGCRWVTTESANGARDGGGVNNLRRFGFTAVYERRHWVAELAEPSTDAMQSERVPCSA